METEKRKKILIADDSKVYRDLEGDYLRKQGFDLIFAEDGAQAVRFAVEEQPDLILLDIQMPIMDGVQALALLKREPRTTKIPIVVVTTISREKDKEILRTGGASLVLSKPIQGPQLIEAITPFLE